MIKPGYRKLMYVMSEMIEGREWPPMIKMKDEIDSIILTLKASEEEGGSAWEFRIVLEKLSGKATPRVGIWNDAWCAFKEAPEIFEVLEKFGEYRSHNDFSDRWPKLIKALEEAGWEKVKPVPVVDKWPEPCPTCGKA